MTEHLNETLPDVLRTVRTRPLFVVRLDVRKLQLLGGPPAAYRRVGVVPGGVFEGERLSGVVLDGGSDWQTMRNDGSTLLDVRLVLQASGGALIAMTYRGVRHGPADVIARLEGGETVDPADYYFRISPMFETADPGLAWINRIVTVGIGHRTAAGPVYSLFEVL